MVRTGSMIRIDRSGGMQGRGCYICSAASCVSRARKHDLVSRRFGLNVPSRIYTELAQITMEQARSHRPYLGLAVKAGKCVLGLDSVKRALKKGDVRIVLYDGEASAASLDRLISSCRAAGIPAFPFRGAERLDTAVGKANCRAAGITDNAFAENIRMLESKNRDTA